MGTVRLPGFHFMSRLLTRLGRHAPKRESPAASPCKAQKVLTAVHWRGTHMHEEMDENQNEVEVYEVFEPHHTADPACTADVARDRTVLHGASAILPHHATDIGGATRGNIDISQLKVAVLGFACGSPSTRHFNDSAPLHGTVRSRGNSCAHLHETCRSRGNCRALVRGVCRSCGNCHALLHGDCRSCGNGCALLHGACRSCGNCRALVHETCRRCGNCRALVRGACRSCGNGCALV